MLVAEGLVLGRVVGLHHMGPLVPYRGGKFFLICITPYVCLPMHATLRVVVLALFLIHADRAALWLIYGHWVTPAARDTQL